MCILEKLCLGRKGGLRVGVRGQVGDGGNRSAGKQGRSNLGTGNRDKGGASWR